MYLPRAFAETDLAALDGLAKEDGFITLVTVRDSMPTVSHLPVLYQREGDQVRLSGHWARPNPQAGHAGPALAILQGPHAYVSPSWYPDKEPASRVPTWNYAVAHLHGRLQTFDDEASLAGLVDRLGCLHEARVGSDWRFEAERPDHRLQLRGIIGFDFIAEVVELKFKLSQNHPLANRVAVVEQLERRPDASSHGVARLMRDGLPAGSGTPTGD